MNETIESILNRRSIRKYEAKPVEQEKIDLIIECARFAPSARNLQPWHFTVITRRDVLDRISEANRQIMLKSPVEMLRSFAQAPDYDSFRGAPLAIIASGRKGADYAPCDCANAVENMALAAYSLGLGSCYLGSFKICLEAPGGDIIQRELGIPEDYQPLYALSVGYGSEILGERQPRAENTVALIG